MPPIYMPDVDYDRLVAALLNLAPDPGTGEVGPDQIKIALGNAGNVWPERIDDAQAVEATG